HNRLIRRCLPKGTKTTTPKEVAAIEHWINHYPKRLFNYKSPVEMLKLANFNLKFGSHNFILFSHIDTMVLNELIGVTHNHF
ncbi:hypothetical protein ACUHZQ_07845, partial [Streptococcus pyogenes]